MPDDQQLPTLPADAPTPWLARNRKIVILGGLAVVLVAVVIIMTVQSGSPSTNTSANNGISTTNTLTNTASTRPTFQRSTITNTATTLPPPYRPPSADELRQAIINLNSSTPSQP